ncbi:hypothetical protein ACKWTF_013371 [Chironomus riparius]
MDKSRYKRPPDVDEALSSMLWTPYDQTVNTSSSSTDSLSDDEREREKRKLNRYSNPLPSSLNWWNSHVSNIHPTSLRYSFPFNGNYLPPLPQQQQQQYSSNTATTITCTPHDNDNMTASSLTSPTASSLSIGTSSTVTAKRLSSGTLDMDNNSNGHNVNTSQYPTTMIHSFTDDFYQYQHQQTTAAAALKSHRQQQYPTNCQSTHNNKNCKSQPSLYNKSNTQIIDTTHLVASTSNSTTSNITTLPMQFNHQRNMNVRTVSANIWQNNKTGNSGDPYSSSLYNNHVEQQQACTNTYQIMETSTLSGKVTQPTSSINCVRRGNEALMKHSETLSMSGGSNAMATKQISHDLNSNENTIYALSENNNNNKNKYSHDEQGNNQQNEYRLILLNRNMNGADECKIYHNNIINNTSDNNVVQMPSLSLLSHHHHHNNNIHPQMPSSSQHQQKFVHTQKFTNNPVSLTTNNVSNDVQFDASTALLNVPCTSSVLSFQNYSNNEYQMTTTEAVASTINKYEYDNKLTVDANCNSVDVQKMMNCVNVECYINNTRNNNNENIDNELQSSENNEQTTMNAQTTASADNLIITSAIENISTATTASTAHGTPNKTEKYSNDIITMREKRRRDRRDRRLARTRALNGSGQSEILPDVLNNPRPPPYSSLPSQPIIPSIISTVPVNDTRYSFSLPLVRRSTSDRSGKDCCGQWFNGPPLRFLVALVALGGVACTLGGATLGSIALAGSPTSHLTAGLLMTGVGIVLVTISGVAWRMTTSDTHQCTGRCGRRQCSRGNSSFGLLYPEFQHRPPPPSYQASMQEHRLRIMMLDRERQTSNTRASPPPSYRSNTGTLLRPPIQFQRQNQHQQNQHSSNEVQVEVPIDESTLTNDASTSAAATTAYMQLHQSPTSSSSQTITTIASINRPDDNDNALSMILPRDVTSFIKINEMTAKCHRNSTKKSQNEDVTVNCNSRNKISNCSSSNNNIESSDSRCTSYIDRHSNCNKDFDHHNHHHVNRASKIDNVKGSEDYNIECKNVNISNMTELNKALMSNSHVSTLPRSTQTRASFLDRDRCEMGIR